MKITRKLRLFAWLVLLTGVVVPQLAYGDALREAEKMVSEAVSLYSRSDRYDVERAGALFKMAADAGHPLGVMWVARSLFRGRVEDEYGNPSENWAKIVGGRIEFPQDRNLAETLARRVLGTVQDLARGGNAEALFLLASALEDGLATISRDSRQAAGMYLKAANAGHALAQNNLGVMYANGRGVEQSDVKAGEWYRKAAEQGDKTAQLSTRTVVG